MNNSIVKSVKTIWAFHIAELNLLSNVFTQNETDFTNVYKLFHLSIKFSWEHASFKWQMSTIDANFILIIEVQSDCLDATVVIDPTVW